MGPCPDVDVAKPSQATTDQQLPKMTITRAQVRSGAASLFTGALPPLRTVKMQPAVALAVAAGAALIEVVPPMLSPGLAGGGSLNIARPKRLYKLLLLGLLTLYSGTMLTLSGDYPIDIDVSTAGKGPCPTSLRISRL